MTTYTSFRIDVQTLQQLRKIAASNHRKLIEQLEYWIACDIEQCEGPARSYPKKPLMTEEECEKIFGIEKAAE